ncbi:MAG: 50S ribosomal protein L29 [Acidobacteriota bacterium]
MKIAEQLTELRGMTADDLRAKSKDLDDQIFRVRLQLSMGQTESAGKVQPLRRERARVKTVLREKGVKD